MSDPTFRFDANAVNDHGQVEVARALRKAAAGLPWARLRQASWLQIAAAICGSLRGRDILTRRLSAARNRADLLRALRISRQFQRRKTSRGGSRSQSGVRRRIGQADDPVRPHPQLLQLEYRAFVLGLDVDRDEWREYWDPAVDHDAGWQEGHHDPAALERLATTAQPLNRLQVALEQDVGRGDGQGPNSLGQIVGPAVLAMLRQRVDRGPRSPSTAAGQPDVPDPDPDNRQPLSVITELRQLIQLSVDAGDEALQHARIEWGALQRDLLRSIRQPSQSFSSDDRVIARALVFCCDRAPASFVNELHANLLHSTDLHPDWLTLLPWFVPSLLLPRVQGPHLRRADFFRLVRGSALTLQMLRSNHADLLAGIELPEGMPEARPLLAAGGGTLRGLDYPEFTYTCQPTTRIVDRRVVAELRELLGGLQSHYVTFISSPVITMLADLEASVGAHGRALAAADRTALVERLDEHIVVYAMLVHRVLRAEREGNPFRIRRRHLERYRAAVAAGTEPRRRVSDLVIPGGDISGLVLLQAAVHALLTLLEDGIGIADLDRDDVTAALRHLAMCYELRWVSTDEDEEPDEELMQALLHDVRNAPLALRHAMGLPHDAPFPLLRGGIPSPLERRCAAVLRQAAGGRLTADQAPPATFVCRPLTKLAALARGNLAGDCSTDSVPLRALSPHHVYYGIWEASEQKRGYMTVFEAWAEDAEGSTMPVLCLETINVPLGHFAAAAPDLLLLFDAIARSRGLAPQIVVATGHGTWNFGTDTAIAQDRRFRGGTGVLVRPADPVAWNAYTTLTHEAGSYCSLDVRDAEHRRILRGEPVRQLAPFDPLQDKVLPQNLAEAQRLASLPAAMPLGTARDEVGVIGFVTGRLPPRPTA